MGHRGRILARYTFGNATLDEVRQTLEVDGQVVPIEPIPFWVLARLLHTPKTIVTRNELLTTFWSNDPNENQSLTNATGKIRKVLKRVAGCETALETQRGVGLSFSGNVEVFSLETTDQSALELQEGQAAPILEEHRLVKMLSQNYGREVWLAHNAETNEYSVIKYATNSYGLRTLKREASICELLNSKFGETGRVLPVVDQNFVSEPFFVQSRFAGHSLEDWMNAKANDVPSISERLQFAKEVCEAVGQLHAAGISHRDIKPQNLLIELDENNAPHATLIDLGSCTITEPELWPDEHLRKSWMTLDRTGISEADGSSPIYAAPELLKGERGSIRSDVYSLGYILFQLLTWDPKRPLTGNWQDYVTDGVLRQDIIKSIHNDPTERFDSATDLLISLQNYEERSQISKERARVESELLIARERMEIDRKRRPWVITAFASLLLGSIVSSWFALEEATAREEAESRRVEAEASTQFVMDLLVLGDPRAADQGPNITMRDALNRAQDIIYDRYKDNDVALSQSLLVLASSFRGSGDIEAERDTLRQAVDALIRIYGESHPKVLGARIQLARAEVTIGQFTSEKKEYEAVTKLIEDPSTLSLENQWAYFDMLARASSLRLQHQKALQFYDKVEAIRKQIAPNDRRREVISRMARADTLATLTRTDEAISELEALRVAGTDKKEELPGWLKARLDLVYSRALMFGDRGEEAIPILENARVSTMAAFGDENARYYDVIAQQCINFGSLGYIEEASEPCLTSASALCRINGNDTMACLFPRFNSHFIRAQAYGISSVFSEIEQDRERLDKLIGKTSPQVLQLVDYYLAIGQIKRGDLETAANTIATLNAEDLSLISPNNPWDDQIPAIYAWLVYKTSPSEKNKNAYERAIINLREVGVHEMEIALLQD